jgi:hypothetical protein
MNCTPPPGFFVSGHGNDVKFHMTMGRVMATSVGAKIRVAMTRCARCKNSVFWWVQRSTAKHSYPWHRQRFLSIALPRHPQVFFLAQTLPLTLA